MRQKHHPHPHDLRDLVRIELSRWGRAEWKKKMHFGGDGGGCVLEREKWGVLRREEGGAENESQKGYVDNQSHFLTPHFSG